MIAASDNTSCWVRGGLGRPFVDTRRAFGLNIDARKGHQSAHDLAPAGPGTGWGFSFRQLAACRRHVPADTLPGGGLAFQQDSPLHAPATVSAIPAVGALHYERFAVGLGIARYPQCAALATCRSGHSNESVILLG